MMRPDFNSQGFTQWFYFKISNTKQNLTYRFNIANFVKSDSMYNHGMKILFYSTKKAEDSAIGWYRGGNEICYYQNTNKSGSNYTLSFNTTFQDDDEVYIAHWFPYTYTDL